MVSKVTQKSLISHRYDKPSTPDSEKAERSFIAPWLVLVLPLSILASTICSLCVDPLDRGCTVSGLPILGRSMIDAFVSQPVLSIDERRGEYGSHHGVDCFPLRKVLLV